MFEIAKQYVANCGGIMSGATQMALDLMRDDQARRGYTAENAVLAVRDAFALTEEQASIVADRLEGIDSDATFIEQHDLDPEEVD